jgi:23S rRNA (cytidine1920-2'-O)/16S rRNA (cytidine1409-2'-O)-methyltransferase
VKKERLDVLLVKKGYFPSREQAQRAIMAGLVLANQQRIDKAGTKVPSDAEIKVKGRLHPYVSRGGLKLEEALRAFSLSMEGKIVIDVGASTGGFTDCALQNGAKLVYAVDVGYGQLAWKLRKDPRVIVMERTNFRYVEPDSFTEGTPDVATIDVSFISLVHILPPLKRVLREGGEVIALVKPQFEAGKEFVGKKGIVKDPKVHRHVLERFVSFAQTEAFTVQGLAPSPIQGGEGNIEFLSYLVYQPDMANRTDINLDIDKIVQQAHAQF